MNPVAKTLIAAAACAVSGPAVAGDGGLAILGLDERAQATSSAAAPAGDGDLGVLGLEQERQALPDAPAASGRGRYGGGFIELLITGGRPQAPRGREADPSPQAAPLAADPAMEAEGEPQPQFLRHEVEYAGSEAPGTIIIDTPDKFLFYVEPNRRALRYGIGVGRPGFEWSGVKHVTRKAEWPAWTPPPQMLLRRPDLPAHMAGGPGNPLGARALYLGSSLYRIHGTNDPSTIGQNVSSGCIRMMNADVIDLYNRVPVGAKVIVL
jgi:lipoprotein-anchoring transpeptidase ErfK/SrfK